MQFEAERETLKKAHRQIEPEAWIKKTAGRTTSIDGLPTRASIQYIAGE